MSGSNLGRGIGSRSDSRTYLCIRCGFCENDILLMFADANIHVIEWWKFRRGLHSYL